MSINLCDTCKEITAVTCYGFLRLDIGQAVNTNYTAFIEDKFGNFFKQSVISDGVGSVTLNIDNFPDGLFTPYSGKFTFSLSTSSLNSTYETLNIDSDVYHCILLSFVNVE